MDRDIGYVFMFRKETSKLFEVRLQVGQFYRKQQVGFCHLSCVQYYVDSAKNFVKYKNEGVFSISEDKT